MVRDYCYVGDVVKVNIIALSKNIEGVFNIGTGIPTKTLELYRIIYDAIKAVKKDLPSHLKEPERGPARPGDLKWSCLDIGKAKSVLNWKPEVDLKQGIKATLKWWLGVK